MDDKPKILIIDDEEIVRDSCIQILANSNYEIATAPNGAEGLNLMEEFQPDMAFVDLKMPGMSGYEVLDEIHQYDPTIVTIVITGFATVGSAVESMKKGTFDFLPKPFTPDELRLITRRGLDRRKLLLETIALRREKETLREHFAAIVSHELKSPLGAVQTNLYVLGDDLADKLTEEQKEKFERLQGRIGDLVKLINTWLRAISVDISSIRDNFEPVSIATVVAKAVENTQLHATRKAIDIETSIEEPLTPVNGDEGTLVEAVVNIVGNAVKYTHMEGLIVVYAKQSGDEITITVTDNGVGIAKEDIPHLFEDFYVGKSKTEGERRSGVGLAITRRIIEAHDGHIDVESEIGKGSTFAIHLPVLKE
ncbi:MAG: response regulator [Anaerolineales bacterium]|nr:response regulator [Anaerolineales bacterium]